MASPEVHHLFHHPIADHSFSADRQTLAVARDNQVELYGRSGGKFTLQDELKGHDKTVTSVDIAPTTGQIVTCSQGMYLAAIVYNVYYADPSVQTGMPTYGNLHLRLEAHSSSSASTAPPLSSAGPLRKEIRSRIRRPHNSSLLLRIRNDWWVSKHLKKPIRSTITTLSWHPNSVLLAAGSTDAHARVFSSFIKESMKGLRAVSGANAYHSTQSAANI